MHCIAAVHVVLPDCKSMFAARPVQSAELRRLGRGHAHDQAKQVIHLA